MITLPGISLHDSCKQFLKTIIFSLAATNARDKLISNEICAKHVHIYLLLTYLLTYLLT